MSYLSAVSSSTRGRDASSLPPLVSERCTSPSLPKKIRQVKNRPIPVPQNTVVGAAGFHYKRHCSALTPNLAAMASLSADLLEDPIIHDVLAETVDQN